MVEVSALIADLKSVSAAALPDMAVHSLSSFPYYGNVQRQEQRSLGSSLDKTPSGKDSSIANRDLHDSKLLTVHLLQRVVQHI